MRVSIVTISYNQGRFLERTICSVLEQDYDDIEYIVEDPGSTDGSREIIERYRDRITKIIFEPDNGSADGLNKGFAQATGEIYGFLNSDDVLFSHAVSRVVSFFRDHSDVDIVSGHSVVIDENDREIRKSYSDKFSLLRCAYGTGVLMQPSTFFRAAAFHMTGGFNTANKTNWDGELFVDMCRAGATFTLIEDFLSGFRLHPESITSSKKLDEGVQAYQRAAFRKIMERDRDLRDFPLFLFFRVMKYMNRPKALYERLSKGPVYGGSAGTPLVDTKSI